MDLFPREFDLNFVRLLTVVIEERANVDPETSLSQDFRDSLNVLYNVVSGIKEEAGDDAIPCTLLLRFGVDLNELSCDH